MGKGPFFFLTAIYIAIVAIQLKSMHFQVWGNRTKFEDMFDTAMLYVPYGILKDQKIHK